jgi:hypothetical protein
MTAHDDLLAVAVAQTGLEDFGDDSFREGLEILVRSLHEEARLNSTGEAVIYPRLVEHLVNRLQIEDWYRRYPDTEDVPVVAPLIGLSLPRTGSTVLSFLLARDPEIRYLRGWESSQPCPPPRPSRGLTRASRTRRATASTSARRSTYPSMSMGPWSAWTSWRWISRRRCTTHSPAYRPTRHG